MSRKEVDLMWRLRFDFGWDFMAMSDGLEDQ